MSFDTDGARALGFGERLTRELRDGLRVDVERLAEETLGEDSRELDGAIELRLGGAFFSHAKRRVERRDLRLLGFRGLARRVLRDALRLRARLGHDRVARALRIRERASGVLFRFELGARELFDDPR